MKFPDLHRVTQKFAATDLAEPASVARQAILESKIASRLKPGARVAITAGSRGIAGIASILQSIVTAVRDLGFDPIIVGAMGSHGGATAQGQLELLGEFGITSTAMNCQIHTEMETVELGVNSFGLPICFDANAHAADGIIVVNRIKPHTSFTGQYESGLLKMLAIGLGKREGASQVHKLGLPGLKKLIPEVGTFLLRNTSVVLGLAILENAREQTARIVPVEPEDILEQEPKLLDEAREMMGRLPFDSIDFLVVGELGKNY
ncbi:MAG: lactate racemase domain-containing protein, partial [Planctomycetota bacterium]|nr:lactate racemase domain-containing protein [Planctomycetota bacterium]